MEQLSIFTMSDETSAAAAFAPLADRMRPQNLEDYIGQQHLLGKGKILRQMLEKDMIPSMIFWGPPGVGKTTLARIIANRTKSGFVNFSAVTSGIKAIKDIMKQAEENRSYGGRTLCFVDEIHRFNKAQQDAFLPYVEKGSITLIGATTENPSFEINAALLSRCKVFVLKELNAQDEGAWVRVACSEDGGPFRPVWASHDSRAGTAVIPLLPGRCDRFQIRISGRGGCLLRSLEREFSVGSER